MSRIFLTPVKDLSKESGFAKTVLNKVLYQGNIECLWGVISHEKTWSKLKINDKLFIYNAGRIVYILEVKGKTIDTEFSKKTWHCKVKISGELIFYDKIILFNKIINTDFSYDLIKEMAEYKPKASVRYFFELSETGHKSLIEKFGSINCFIEKTTATNKYVYKT
jgi:hypothetical protein